MAARKQKHEKDRLWLPMGEVQRRDRAAHRSNRDSVGTAQLLRRKLLFECLNALAPHVVADLPDEYERFLSTARTDALPATTWAQRWQLTAPWVAEAASVAWDRWSRDGRRTPFMLPTDPYALAGSEPLSLTRPELSGDDSGWRFLEQVGARGPEWFPFNETEEQFAERVKRYQHEVVRVLVAAGCRQEARVAKYCEEDHCRWFVRYQALKMTWQQVAQTESPNPEHYHLEVTTVAKGAQNFAKRVGIAMRKRKVRSL